MGNFIDRTFTIIADFILKLLPTSKKEKQAFSYYRAGMAAQSKGRYAEALKNYFESLQLEEDAYDRSYSLYNIGLIYGNMGKKRVALEFYHQAIALNSNLPQALNNIGVIYHSEAIRANCFAQTINQLESEIIDVDKYETYSEMSKELFDKAGDYWMEALLLAPDNYPGARNWLKVTGRIYKLLDD